MAAQNLPFWSKIRLLALLGAAGLVACGDRVSDDQLETWYQEAVLENQRLKTTYAPTAKQEQWQLIIQGQTKTGQDYVLNWQTLQDLAQTYVLAKDPNLKRSEEISQFRGIPVSVLLEQVGLQSDVQEVTFAASDGFRGVVPIADLQRYPISLAIERDGQPISRSEGGPIYLVFPNQQSPELNQRYSEVNWVFYVTQMIVGYELLHLKVNGQELNRFDLADLPQITINTEVGYRLFWPSGKVNLRGVSINAVLQTTGIHLSPETVVTVLGKAPIHRNPAKPIQISGQDLLTCDILLITHWNDQFQAIPAKMGGPITLAFSPDCPVEWIKTQPWTIFVEALEVANP